MNKYYDNNRLGVVIWSGLTGIVYRAMISLTFGSEGLLVSHFINSRKDFTRETYLEKRTWFSH